MSNKDATLRATFTAIDKVSKPLSAMNKQIAGVRKALSGVKGAGSKVGEVFAPLAKAGALVGGAMGAAAGYILHTASAFEKYQTILETIEGSSDKAKSSMKWVSDFAAKTPYEMDQVTDAFVKLKSYGIDPQGGALKSAGDAAAAMGKPLNQAVEALADAMTGENERLKEFGIKASKTGDKITYSWNENGKTMHAAAKASSGKQIQAVVQGIWNRRYSGAMDKLSGTWDGMLSNLQDSIARFALEIGNAGLFDYLKGELSALLTKLNAMAADGSLKAFAAQVSNSLVAAFKALQSIDFEKITFWAKIIFGAVMLAQVVSIGMAVYGLAAAMGTLGVALTPVIIAFAPIIAAVALLGAAAYLLWKNWDDVMGGLKLLWEDFSGWIGPKIDSIMQKFAGVRQFFSGVAGMFGGSNGGGAQPSGGRAAGMGLNAGGKQNVQGEMVVRFEGAPPGMRVDQGKTNTPGFSLNPDVGYRSQAWGAA